MLERPRAPGVSTGGLRAVGRERCEKVGKNPDFRQMSLSAPPGRSWLAYDGEKSRTKVQNVATHSTVLSRRMRSFSFEIT